MNKIVLLFAISISIWSCADNKKESATTETPVIKIDSTLVTDTSWGLINKNTDRQALDQRYGSANVRDERICGPECADSIDVTKVYPGKINEMIIHWKDSLYHRAIDLIVSEMPASPYRTNTGLRIGSTLTELLKVNGKKISFSGFGWDYGGYIQSYHNGSLENSPILLHLELAENSTEELYGDSEFNTDMPAVKAVVDKILISGITLSWHNRN